MSDNRIILHVDMELYRCVSDEVMEILRRFSNIVKKLQISGYPISEHGNCRYFEGKRKT